MKKSYHVTLWQKNKNDENLQKVFIDNFYCGYKNNKAAAVKYSFLIGTDKVKLTNFDETEKLNKGLAAVSVLCYITEKRVLKSEIHEFYENGKLIRTKETKY